MAALKIPTAYDPKAVLLADDEPEHLEWLVDYLAAKGLSVVIATNVQDAMNASEKSWYRMYIIDLNIPLGGWCPPGDPVFLSYPGLSIIQSVRSQGNGGTRVIAYSAHSNSQIEGEIGNLYTDYVAKGRPQQLKDRINELLSRPDATAISLGKGRPSTT